MSDDQSDFTNKPRRSKAAEPDSALAPGQVNAGKESLSPKTGKATRVKSEPVAAGTEEAKVSRKPTRKGGAVDTKAELAGEEVATAERKVAKSARKAERKKAAKASKKEEAAAIIPAVRSDEEKAEVKSQRKAARVAKRRAKKGAPDPALPVAVSSGENETKVKPDRKAARAAKRSARKGKSDVPVPVVVSDDEKKTDIKSDRKAARAAKRSARKGKVDAPLPIAAPIEGNAKSKADRKAEKAAKRTAEKNAPVLTPHVAASGDEDRAKDKSERKAAKAAKKAASGSAPAAAVPGDEEKGEIKAKRKAARVAKRSAKKGEPSLAAPLVAATSDEKKDKADRKAAKAEKKAAKKNSLGAISPVTAQGEADNAKTDRKAAKAAKREKKKSARGDGGGADLSDAQQAEAKAARKAKKAEKKADRKNRKSGGGEGDTDEARETRIALTGFEKTLDGRIRARVEALLKDSGAAFQWAETDGKSDLAVYAFENPPVSADQIGASIDTIAKDRAKFRIFIGRAGAPTDDGADPFAGENHAIAMLASDFDGAFVDAASLCRRYGGEHTLKNGTLTDLGVDLIVTAILGIAAGGRVAKSALPRLQWPVPSDLAEVRALSATDVLAQLSWSGPKAPKLLWTHASKESMEAFLDSKVALSEEQSLDLKLPISWPPELPNRAAETKVLGLEFLSGPLNYWYLKASGGNDGEVDALIRARGATAGDILARAGKIIVDYVENYPLSNSTAWEENAVSRRARVLALFVLCCKTAAKRKVKFDEAVFLRVFNELLNLIEVLRAPDFYEPGSFDGVQQDSLLAGLALTLRKTAYAEKLLVESVERLKSLQLNVGLTADGVWRAGTFSDHCTLLSQFKTMLGDFSQADAALKEPIAAAAKKMTVFAEALLKSDGSPPVFDNSRQKSYLKKLAGTRRALAGAGFSKNAPAKGKPMPRITDTYVFREAQYFASHTTRSPIPDSSLVILHREAGSVARDNPGGIALAFAHGEKDLLVGADPEEGTKKKDKAAYFDASLRNGYQINGTGYVPEQDFKPDRARLTKSWRGEGWAAAKSIDETNPAGSMVRTVIHLKPQHALIVVDELRTAGGSEASFEQFWHIAPGLTAPDSAQAPLNFTGAEGGNLTVAFDARGAVALEPEGEGGTATCVRRSFKLAKGVVASLFQWADAPAPAALKMLGEADGSWSLEASGNGFDASISLAGEELRYEPKTAV